MLGLLGSWQYYEYQFKINNTPEKKARRIVNSSIQIDICERIEQDIKKFKDSPNTYQRTSLNILEQETKRSLRKLLLSQGISENYPIEYEGSESAYEKCKDKTKEWVNIPSIGSQSLYEEASILGIKEISDMDNKSSNGKPSFSKDAKSKRIALVIGNAEYRNRPLKNPKADAEDMSDFLRSVNFNVIYIANADLIGMREGFIEFNEALKSNDVGLIYYSGHGIEHKGRNYLLPVNFNANDEDEIPRQAIDLSSIIEKISRAERKINIVIVDACRSNFVTASNKSYSQGLKEMTNPKGTILAFATAPGKLAEDGNGRNSPYTKNLIQSMKVPGKRIEDVFKQTAKNVEIETAGRQIPWYNSSLTVDFSIK